MQLKSQLDEYGITLNSPPAPETPPLSAETKNAASRAADREVQMLRAKVAAAKKRRELFSREVLALEKQTETVRVGSLFHHSSGRKFIWSKCPPPTLKLCSYSLADMMRWFHFY